MADLCIPCIQLGTSESEGPSCRVNPLELRRIALRILTTALLARTYQDRKGTQYVSYLRLFLTMLMVSYEQLMDQNCLQLGLTFI